MVFVKVRETYDLQTVRNKMTVIGIHTPKPDIIKRNFPGLLMQCKAYRPVSADVRVACASIQPLDPRGVGLADGDVAPEDIFNPILYKAMSNKGMSQLEARINSLGGIGVVKDVDGQSAWAETNDVTSAADEFPIYYGLLANAHDWKHANPQSGLQMTGLRPLVYEMIYNIGDTDTDGGVLSPNAVQGAAPGKDDYKVALPVRGILGKSKPMPFIPCTEYSLEEASKAEDSSTWALPGFQMGTPVGNCSINVPWLNVHVGCIIVPPSRLHELFYRMVVEWTIEFSMIRPLAEITNLDGLAHLGTTTHFKNYDYSKVKEAINPDQEEILVSDTCMVDSNVSVRKVM